MTITKHCGPTCDHPHHTPFAVRQKKVNCTRYNAWLNGQARSCRARDQGLIDPLPAIEEYRTRIHDAVIRSEGRDEYTGELLEWNRLNHPRPEAGGRKRHLQRCSYPSVDHYFGPGRLDYRICSGVTNLAKGAMDHQRFVDLCRKVAAHHEGWGKPI